MKYVWCNPQLWIKWHNLVCLIALGWRGFCSPPTSHFPHHFFSHLDREGDPGQCPLNAEDIRGHGELQRRFTPPTGNKGDSSGVLWNQSAPAGADRLRTSHPATSRCSGGKKHRRCMETKYCTGLWNLALEIIGPWNSGQDHPKIGPAQNCTPSHAKSLMEIQNICL